MGEGVRLSWELLAVCGPNTAMEKMHLLKKQDSGLQGGAEYHRL